MAASTSSAIVQATPGNRGRFSDEIAKSLRAFLDKWCNDGITQRQKDRCLLFAAVCVTTSFDRRQFVSMVTGAVFYLFFRKCQTRHSTPVLPPSTSEHQNGHNGHSNDSNEDALTKAAPPPSPGVPAREMRTLTTRPIEQPAFEGVGWEAEVAELLKGIMPSSESHAAVERIADNVRASLHHYYPGVEVVGFAAGDFRRGKAFGVAVPEVDIVMSIKPEVLIHRFMESQVEAGRTNNFDVSKVQKSALRECIEILVAGCSYKFRRSAFRGLEPKVTLLSPATNGDQGVPIDLSINASTPLHNMALLTECGRMEPRARELILLVRRWTKDRGVCHATKGYLSPYLWSLLTMYFLQVGVGAEGPLLPPLEQFDLSSCLDGKRASATSEPQWSPAPYAGKKRSTASLFKDFVRFYHTQFDWVNEAVSIRNGKRLPPSDKLPLHILESGGQGQQTQFGISIEDPFTPSRNLGNCLNSATFARSREELKRAHELCSNDASLTDLLELWAPPDESASTADAKPAERPTNGEKIVKHACNS
eukprot:TRINITY_DN9134_c0_g1_i1.p1 TRINITY_DN9134_c0_g1~~TRINITY_DN9134_c0_g1_i1.p1  ORF type:complete len:534 (-),score=87.94 TRINITY_DN9134_c0_g1_i1:276-1877(-)